MIESPRTKRPITGTELPMSQTDETRANISETLPAPGPHEAPVLGVVQVSVGYLPATQPYHHPYPGETVLETVRTDSMQFFGVQDRQERDTYRYFLEFEGQRVSNTSQTLRDLLGPHRLGAHFNL